MSDPTDSTAQIPNHVSRRNPTACEQCRLARVKCQASEQPGVCERCLALKRECIARTRARPRRWERRWGTGGGGVSSPSLATPVNDTFRIHYSVPVQADLDDNFETLCHLHEQNLDGVLLEESQAASSAIAAPNGRTSSSSPCQPRSLSDIWRQPVFSLASAESLLGSFQPMLTYLPFFSFPQDPQNSSVSSLATARPFTLLSILTVTSGLRSAQKHTLYDGEFRKALGLKYVSGGETSLEILQGLLIYCAWYPFHLRPNNGQLLQYLRMASGLVHDLRLDHNFLQSSWHLNQPVTDDELEKIRAYLAYMYLVSTYITVWKGGRSLPVTVSSWTIKAVDTLLQHACTDRDHTLVALVRLSLLFCDVSAAVNEADKKALGVSLRLRYHELHAKIARAPAATNAPSVIQLQLLFLDIFLDCGSLLDLPVSKTKDLSTKMCSCFPTVSALCSTATKLQALLLLYQGELDDSSLLSFTINDWTRLIVVLTLAFRLSFPLSSRPEFDSAWARSEIRLDQFLSHAVKKTTETPSSSSSTNDIISANRAVLGVVKTKFDRRLALINEPALSAAPSMGRMYGCPMMDANFRRSMQQWVPDLTDFSLSSTASSEEDTSLQFEDMWAASMTMGLDSGWDVGFPWSSSEANLDY